MALLPFQIDLSEILQSLAAEGLLAENLMKYNPTWKDASFTLKYYSDALFDFPHWLGRSKRSFQASQLFLCTPNHKIYIWVFFYLTLGFIFTAETDEKQMRETIRIVSAKFPSICCCTFLRKLKRSVLISEGEAYQLNSAALSGVWYLNYWLGIHLLFSGWKSTRKENVGCLWDYSHIIHVNNKKKLTCTYIFKLFHSPTGFCSCMCCTMIEHVWNVFVSLVFIFLKFVEYFYIMK